MIELDALLQRLKDLVSKNSPDDPTIADDDIRIGDIKALVDEIERLRRDRQRLILDHISSEGQWIEHTGELNQRIKEQEAELKEFKSFVKEIRDGYDCDTGASGVHAHRCRCCVAGDLLGEPPSVFDQRTRGG